MKRTDMPCLTDADERRQRLDDGPRAACFRNDVHEGPHLSAAFDFGGCQTGLRGFVNVRNIRSRKHIRVASDGFLPPDEAFWKIVFGGVFVDKFACGDADGPLADLNAGSGCLHDVIAPKLTACVTDDVSVSRRVDEDFCFYDAEAVFTGDHKSCECSVIRLQNLDGAGVEERHDMGFLHHFIQFHAEFFRVQIDIAVRIWFVPEFHKVTTVESVNDFLAEAEDDLRLVVGREEGMPYADLSRSACTAETVLRFDDGDACAFSRGGDRGEDACATAAGHDDIDVCDDGYGTRWKLNGFSHGFLLKCRVENAFFYNV